MVLESLIGEKNIRKKPFLVLLITFIISIGSIIFAHAIFPSHASVLSVAFITIGLVPIIHNILTHEDFNEVLQRKNASTFFARHFNVIQMYVWVFVGVILAFSFLYIVFPIEMKQTVFQEQINSFCLISGDESCVTGIPKSISGMFSTTAFNSCQNPSTSNLFSCSLFIFENNGTVLLFTIILSLLYGAGAIFIIAWNASILGIFFGEIILSTQYLRGFGLLQGLLIGHGPPELLGYIFGALAGAILSAMISRNQFLRHEFLTIIKDFFLLVFLAVFSIIYGAIVEAMGITGMIELYFLFGFIYVFLILIIIFIYGRKKIISQKIFEK
ncbi:MAG: stage II sporulation protein M [Candidatus ainarchaeum sp.]|nr:stage II sporulation protein M [Candidatus ainarchaeum sp.]